MTPDKKKFIISQFLETIQEICDDSIDNCTELEDPLQEILSAVFFLEKSFNEQSLKRKLRPNEN